MTFGWDAATDKETTNANGLTYNLRVGLTPGGCEVLSPHANATTGFRRLPALGNAQHRLTATLTNLRQGVVYYWSVQAVDTGYAGSAFAGEHRVYVGPPKILSVEHPAPSQFRMVFGGQSGLNYTLQTSANLSDWTDRINLVAGPEGLFEWLEPASSETPVQFYRLQSP